MTQSPMGTEAPNHFSEWVAASARIQIVGKEQPAWNDVCVHENANFLSHLASQLQSASQHGASVVIALSDWEDTLTTILASLWARLPFCVLAPDRMTKYASALELISPSFAVTDDTYRLLASRPQAPRSSEAAATKRAPPDADKMHSAEVVYYQPTSGSGGIPKLVPVTRKMLKAQFEGMIERTHAERNDTMVSWAPLSHDMGLMAALLPLHVGGKLILSSPARFKLSPVSWLSDIEKFEGTLTTAPVAALRILNLRWRGKVPLRLNSLRYAWIGAEMVWNSVLQQFHQTFADNGLSDTSLRPTYGMAETVVGIAFPHPNSKLQLSSPVSPRSSYHFVSHGSPIQGLAVQVWDPCQRPLPDGHIGEVMVRGDTVAESYAGSASDLIDGWRNTGDLGFLHSSEVYITGRRKDILIQNGVNHSAETVEECVRLIIGDPTARVAAVSTFSNRRSKELVHLILEERRGYRVDASAITQQVFKMLGLAIDEVHLREKGYLPHTTSGKIQREQLRNALTIEL